MDLDPDQLKEKALLLLQRERELFDLRMKHERVTVWLKLTQALPQIFADPHLELRDACLGVRKTLLDGLRLQRVLFFEVDGSLLRPLAPAGPARALSPEGLSASQAETVGVVNGPTNPAGAALADAFGLARFIWSRIDLNGGAPIILAAGYDRSKAKYNAEFDASDAANLRNVAQHIQGLIGNALLIQQVERERDRLALANQTLERREAELRSMAEELRSANETLEQRVAERTEQLRRRNCDMRLVLDNVVMALVTVDAAGRLSGERSAKVDEWFGSYDNNPLFADYIANVDGDFGALFALAHEALVEGSLPIELCLHQLPTKLCSKERTYRCSYQTMSGTAEHTGLLVVIEDVTEQLRLTREEAEQSELLAVFQGLTRDRTGFLTFFAEADQLLQRLASDALDHATRRRHLHTLKGNAAMMGATVVADLCHRAEDDMAVDGSAIDSIVRRLQERWSAIRETLEAVVGERGKEDIVEIPMRALDELRDQIQAGMSSAQIERKLASFRLEPVAKPLARLSRYANALAHRMGKTDLSVVIDADEACVDPQRFGEFWAALVHLVRNALDHGIESAEERVAWGKRPAGRLMLRATHTQGELMVEVEDDGRGIDWERVARLAGERGMAHRTEKDLLSAILSDGFSTRSTVTATSGRGVGLSAVYQQVCDLGGVLSVRTQAGRGTCWQTTLPLSPARAPHAAARSRAGTPSPR